MADNITFRQPMLDLSGVPNVYESSRAPMHGYAEAIRKRRILQQIDRMRRTQAILQASGMNVSDWTQGLSAEARSIAPDQTRTQVEKANALRLLGDIIRQYKPRNRRQLENIVVASGLGPDLMEDAFRMAKAFLQGERKTLFRVDDGELSTVTGQERDPRFIAAQERGEAVPQFVATEQLSQHGLKEQANALKYAETLNITDRASLQKALTEMGQKYQDAPDSLGFNPYDKDVRAALFSEYEKVMKTGELAPLWYLEKDKSGRTVERMVMKPKNGGDWNTLIKEKNAVTKREHLGLNVSMRDQWNAAMVEAAELAKEGDILGATASWKERVKGLWSADPAGELNKFLDFAGKPLKDQLSYTKLKMETRTAVETHLSKKQIALASPEIDEGINFIFQKYQDSPAGTKHDYKNDVSRLIDHLFPEEGGEFGTITEPARAEIKKRFTEELKFRQEQVKFGLDVQAKLQDMDATDLTMQVSEQNLKTLIAKNISIGQQGVVDRIINEAYQQFKNNDGRVNLGPVPDETLSAHISRRLRNAGVTMMPELRTQIATEIDRFEKAYIAAKQAPYNLQKARQEAEGTKIDAGTLWDEEGNSKPYRNAQQKADILEERDNVFVYDTNPKLMSPIDKARLSGEVPNVTTKWNEHGGFKVAKNMKELGEIEADGFNLDANPYQLSAVDLAKEAGTYPASGVLFSPNGKSKPYKTTGELNALLAGDEYVYKENPMTDATIRQIGGEIRTLPHLKEGVKNYEEMYFKYDLAQKDMESAWKSETPGMFDLPVIDMWKKITDQSMITQEELRSYLAAQGYKLAFMTRLDNIQRGAQLSGPQRQAMMTAIHHALTVRGSMLMGYYSHIKGIYNKKYGAETGGAIFEMTYLPRVRELERPNFTSPIYLQGAKDAQAPKGRKIKIIRQRVVPGGGGT